MRYYVYFILAIVLFSCRPPGLTEATEASPDSELSSQADGQSSRSKIIKVKKAKPKLSLATKRPVYVMKTYSRPDEFQNDDRFKRFYTQGLVFYNGHLLESTGMPGFSRLRFMEVKASETRFVAGMGEILTETDRSKCKFLKEILKSQGRPLYPDDRCLPHGEGVTVIESMVYLLTWQLRRGIAYQIEGTPTSPRLREVFRFDIPIEGWGLTNNGKQLIISDGSDRLYFVLPDQLQSATERHWGRACIMQLRVNTGGVERDEVVSHYDCEVPSQTFYRTNMSRSASLRGPWVSHLNELEFIKGKIYANVLGTNYVARINPYSAEVESYLDFSELVPTPDSFEDDRHKEWFFDDHQSHNYVLNGLAYDEQRDELYVTGKQWPFFLKVKLDHP